jgi:DNA-binding transcriptional LysR family regulator
VQLLLREMLSPEQATALAAGELDFGFLLPPVSIALEHVVVQRERFVAALPSRHRLARQRGSLAMKDLAGEPLVMVPREIAPGLYDIVAAMAARADLTLNVAQEAIQMQTVVSLVSSGLGAAVVPACMAKLGRRGVVYREIADAHPRLDLWLAWPGGALGVAAQQFADLARKP